MNKPGTPLPNSVKINKFIAKFGVCSRRKAEELVRDGAVNINGNIETNIAIRVIPGKDKVEVNGIPLDSADTLETYILYKPRNCVSTLSDPQGRPTIRDYFPSSSARLIPAGRLDFDTAGLMIITNDGELIQQLMHPSKHVEKVYLVKVKGKLNRGDVAKLNTSPFIDGKKRQPVRVRFLQHLNDKTWIEVVLLEGVNRQIKRMLADIGFPVLKITRVAVGGITLEELRPGQHRKLTGKDIQSLLQPSAS